jgi:hypothetical protein
MELVWEKAYLGLCIEILMYQHLMGKNQYLYIVI